MDQEIKVPVHAWPQLFMMAYGPWVNAKGQLEDAEDAAVTLRTTVATKDDVELGINAGDTLLTACSEGPVELLWSTKTQTWVSI